MKISRNILLLSFGMFGSEAFGLDLDNVQLFAKCYSQLTQMTVTASHPKMIAVRDHRKDPIAACMDVFDKALLKLPVATQPPSVNSETTIVNSEEGLAVLSTMHKFHTTWFDVKDHPGGNAEAAAIQDIIDGETPALHLTRALFKPSARYDSILKATASLKPIRIVEHPTLVGARTGKTKDNYIFKTIPPYTPFAGIGDLKGIREIGATELNRSYSFQQNTNSSALTTGAVNFGTHFGGGIIGEQIYLLQNIGQVRTFVSNGAEKMPRRLARSIYHDLLCRSLPVIRTEDATFVAPNSPVAFRGSSGCVRCHASMDRAAAVARNFTYRRVGGVPGDDNLGFEVVERETVSELAEATWPTAPDPNYYRRPANGVLYFRNYAGVLVNTPVTSLASLGAEIAKQNDFYACAAKRYYNYFVGVDVDLADLEDPPAITLTPKDTFHRENVIRLGTTLKTGQSTRALIEAIFRSPSYRRTDFESGLP